MAHLVTATPCLIQRVDAIAVLPGLGENKRIISAIKAWEAGNSNARYLLVAGTNGLEKTQTQPSIDFLMSSVIGLKKSDRVETQVSAEHTLAQTSWLVDRIKNLGITSLALYVSDWHITRAYSTLIKSLRKSDVLIPVFPVSVPVSPASIIPEYGVTAAAMSAGEAKRIITYQEKGDVATLEELVEYLQWLWDQSDKPIK
jgi:hypothetical protein